MTGVFKIYLTAFIAFMAIDMVWLGVIAKNIYAKYIGELMKSDINWTAALIFYLIFIGGLVFFVIKPALDSGSIKYAVFAGALFGFITYATYDLTNLATLKNWPIAITAIDLVWGSVLCALVSLITFKILFR